nr:hypothetical protein [Candidatus Levybacteria bacterium]
MSELIGQVQEAPKPPYVARELFAARDQSFGQAALAPVIASELQTIQTAPQELLRERYLYAGTYVRGLTGDTDSPYDHHDANTVNNHVRDAIEVRARELGIDTSHIA